MAKVKDRDNFKDIKRKTKSYIQGNPHKTISKNYAGKKGVAWYIHSAGKKTITTKNTLAEQGYQ